MRLSKILVLLAALSLNKSGVNAFQPFAPQSLKKVAATPRRGKITTALQNGMETAPAAQSEASKWRAEAERIRREAAQLDSDLTAQKIESLERKLANQSWLDKHPEEAKIFEEQLVNLKNKLAGKEPVVAATVAKSTTTVESSTLNEKPATKPAIPNGSAVKETPISALPKQTVTVAPTKTKEEDTSKAKRIEENPLNGYDQADLDLYEPVVLALDERLPQNATLAEKLAAFRAAPELQEHFQAKIRKMLVEPMEEMMRLEQLRADYLSSSSSTERKQMKREIEQLEKGMEDDSPFMYSDTIVLEDLPVLEEEEVQQRMEAVGALHPVLQAMYKKRTGIDEEGDLRLAIEMDHYEPQLQLLEQVRYLEPMTDEVRHEIRLAILTLPVSVRNQFAKGLELENGDDVSAMITKLVDGEGEQWMSLKDLVVSTNQEAKGEGFEGGLNLPEYNDLDFLDRSRYLKEFLPSVAKLEIIHPDMEDVETLMREVLDQKTYMVTEAPERVVGGFYIRGRNMVSDPETGSTDDLVQKLQEKLQKSSVKDKLDLFYIQDPSPPTDEEYETGDLDRPMLLVTAKNRSQLYDSAAFPTKAAVSLLGLCSVFLFAAATTQLQPQMYEQVQAAAAGDLSVDVDPILGTANQVFLSMVAIQLAHEMGHRVIAWRDKFEIGLPTIIPSIQLGLQGAITPFKSPPPSNKSMFDFAIAGPLSGILVSFCLLIAGLDITASTDIVDASHFPAFPVGILRSSSLGGGMIEFFLGKGALMSGAGEDVLPLHPFAISGFAGLISNSLALLPLGNTDGGRISQVMFGRRGAYLVKIFTVLILCSLGIFGLDEPRLFLTYVLFSMIWQRDLESPTLNEADELDIYRGVVGIGGSLIVTLGLLPMF